MFANATTQVGISQRVVATLVASALVLLSIGVHSAQAANLTNVSDTLSTSEPGVTSAHTIRFTVPVGSSIAAGDTLTFTFPTDTNEFDGPSVDSVVSGDVSVTVAAVATTTAGFASTDSGAISTITFSGLTVAAGQEVVVAIAGGNIINPTVSGVSYEIEVTDGTDTGKTRVAIVDTVTVSAIVNTTFDFTVSGLATSTETWAGLATTTGSTTATEIPFGELVAGVAETLGQALNVQTNARNGFAVTVHTDGNFRSANGAIIDNFDEGSDVAQTNVAWNSPVPDVNDETSWGHWGVNSNDGDLNSLGSFYSSEFAYNEYIAASTTPRTVYHHDGPADNTTQNIGDIELSYRVEITALQEAADDCQTILTYVATPVF